jgi:hypothetical protein
VDSYRLSSCLCRGYGSCKKIGKNKIQTIEKTYPVTQRTRHLLNTECPEAHGKDMGQECKKEEDRIDLPDILDCIFIDGEEQDYDQDEKGEPD